MLVNKIITKHFILVLDEFDGLKWVYLNTKIVVRVWAWYQKYAVQHLKIVSRLIFLFKILLLHRNITNNLKYSLMT